MRSPTPDPPPPTAEADDESSDALVRKAPLSRGAVARVAAHDLGHDPEDSDEDFTWDLTTIGLAPHEVEDQAPSESRDVSPAPTLGRSQSQFQTSSKHTHKPKAKSTGHASRSRHSVPPPTRKARRQSTRVRKSSSHRRRKPIQPPKASKSAAERGKQVATGKNSVDTEEDLDLDDLTELGKFDRCECMQSD